MWHHLREAQRALVSRFASSQNRRLEASWGHITPSIRQRLQLLTDGDGVNWIAASLCSRAIFLRHRRHI